MTDLAEMKWNPGLFSRTEVLYSRCLIFTAGSPVWLWRVLHSSSCGLRRLVIFSHVIISVIKGKVTWGHAGEAAAARRPANRVTFSRPPMGSCSPGRGGRWTTWRVVCAWGGGRSAPLHAASRMRQDGERRSPSWGGGTHTHTPPPEGGGESPPLCSTAHLCCRAINRTWAKAAPSLPNTCLWDGLVIRWGRKRLWETKSRCLSFIFIALRLPLTWRSETTDVIGCRSLIFITWLTTPHPGSERFSSRWLKTFHLKASWRTRPEGRGRVLQVGEKNTPRSSFPLWH